MELLERDFHLAELAQALAVAEREAGQLVLVSGEAGIGKTSLIEQFARQQRSGRRLLWGACDDLFTPRPLGPLHDIARQTGGALAAQLQTPTDPAAVAAAFLAELQRPTLVIIEDIHWADEATLDLLKYTGRRLGQTRALLLVTLRTDGVEAAPPLRLLLGDLSRNATTRRLELEPLSAAAVRRLAADSALDAEALLAQTGGNPFYLRELLAAGSGEIPVTIRDAVLARVARLSLSGRAVIEAAAVIGARIEPWLLAQVVQAEAPAVAESLALGILRSHEAHYSFRHELTRQTILAALPLNKRMFWHQAVLDVLKGTATDVTQLAHHALGAQDHAAILQYTQQAGQEAAALGLHRAAARWFDQALPYVHELEVAEQIALHEQVGLNNQSVDLEKSRLAFAQSAELARAANMPMKLGHALSRMAVVHYRRAEFTECDRLLSEALTILEPLGPSPALVGTYPLLAMRQLLQGQAAEAIRYADKGHEIAQQLDRVEDQLQAYQIFGLCTMPLDHTEGLAHLRRCLEMSLEHRQYRMAGTLYANLIMHGLDVYDTAGVDRLVTEARAYLQEHDLDFNLNMVTAWEAMLRLYQGRWVDCEAKAQSVLATKAAPIARIPALVALGRLLARRGDAAAAAERLAEAGRLTRQIGNQQRSGIYFCAAAEAAWLADEPEQIEALAAEYLATAIRNRLPGFAAEMAYWLGQTGATPATQPWMVAPYVAELAGEWERAAAGWAALGCPYEQARALAAGTEVAQKEALLLLEPLGAQPLSDRVRQQLREAGVTAIPRGPRATTQNNPFGLTNRQLDVLRLLLEDETNAGIATRLHISPKTVEHHVSAILGKLDVATREEAAERGRQLFP
ncbi:MAG: AAA family ATPase [Ardenticatenales bacterium]|nr:AAA family ATPase [Ardenticatenales bacterium]